MASETKAAAAETAENVKEKTQAAADKAKDLASETKAAASETAETIAEKTSALAHDADSEAKEIAKKNINKRDEEAD